MSSKRFMTLGLLFIGFFTESCQAVPEKRYPIQGEVISAEPQRGTITLKHGEIPGLMPAMTMSYMVADPKQIETLKPGNRIDADLVISESKGRLEKIVVLVKADGKPSP